MRLALNRDLAGNARDVQCEPERYLDELVKLEAGERTGQRIVQLLWESMLPQGTKFELHQQPYSRGDSGVNWESVLPVQERAKPDAEREQPTAAPSRSRLGLDHEFSPGPHRRRDRRDRGEPF